MKHLEPSRCQALGERQAVLGTTPTARPQKRAQEIAFKDSEWVWTRAVEGLELAPLRTPAPPSTVRHARRATDAQPRSS